MTAKEKSNLVRIAETMQGLNQSVKALKQPRLFERSNDDPIERMHNRKQNAFNWQIHGLLNIHKVGREIYYQLYDVAKIIELTSKDYLHPRAGDIKLTLQTPCLSTIRICTLVSECKLFIIERESYLPSRRIKLIEWLLKSIGKLYTG